MRQNTPSNTESCTPVNVDDGGLEIFTHQGVALKNFRSDRSSDNLPTGTLTIVQYKSGKWIEWRKTDVSVESDNIDAEWNLVDTVRKRTCSTSSNADGTQSQPTIRVSMSELKSYKIKRHGRQISLMCPDGQHYSFLFQCGSGDSFINALRAVLNTKRHSHIKNLYLVMNERDESKTLKKSFNELDLFGDQNHTYAWNFVRNLQNRPYETTMQTFSKVADALLYRLPESRPLDKEVAQLLSESFHLDNNDAILIDDYTIVDEMPSILPPVSTVSRGQPLTKEQWINSFDENGRVRDPDTIKQIIFKGGIEPSIRTEVWKYLLGFYQWNYATEERESHRQLKHEKYETMKKQWQTISQGQEDRFSAYRDRKSLVEKDVNRTDRTLSYYAGDDNSKLQTLHCVLMTHVMYNFDLGYVQGMSDLLSPVLYLMDDEIDAFWCFAAFVNRVERNFDMDQAGMKQQLSEVYSLLRIVSPKLALYLDKNESNNMFFCFRWLLVQFKREFSYSEIMTIWEVLWTDLPCPNFHLIICVAVLDMHKDELMKPGNGFTEILKYVNELSCMLKVDEVLIAAETIYQKLKAIDEKLPLPVRRILGFAPPPSQDDESENSDDDFRDEQPSTSKQHNVKGALPGRVELAVPSLSQHTADNPESYDYTGKIGFEDIEQSMGLNYY